MNEEILQYGFSLGSMSDRLYFAAMQNQEIDFSFGLILYQLHFSFS